LLQRLRSRGVQISSSAGPLPIHNRLALLQPLQQRSDFALVAEKGAAITIVVVD
jgi:hypothetical protein